MKFLDRFFVINIIIFNYIKNLNEKNINFKKPIIID